MAQDPCRQCPNLSPPDPGAELDAGNARFVHSALKPRADGCRRDCTKETQMPYAIALSCSDSRVPPEIALDQRIGGLFVVRVAVEAALARQPTHDLVPSLLNRISLAIDGIPANSSEESRLTDAVERNVQYTVHLLPAYSAVIRHAVTDLHVAIQGAYYSVSWGKVA
jgi:carbonic anhydrase